MATMTPMIDAIGIAAQAGPETRRSQVSSGGCRGAATTPAWTASIAASEGMKARDMAPGYGAMPAGRGGSARAETLLERLELLAQLGGQLVAELGVVRLHLRQLGSPAVGIDFEQARHRLLRDIEPVGVDAAGAGGRDK